MQSSVMPLRGWEGPALGGGPWLPCSCLSLVPSLHGTWASTLK